MAEHDIADFLDTMLSTDTLTGQDGFFTDRFGIRTRTSSLPPHCRVYSGKVGSRDGSYDMKLHDTEELNAFLRSVAEADTHLVVMELGAGWGPWLALGTVLAARRGLTPVLIGVEGSSEHFEFMRTHFTDNHIEPERHQLFHAVVGPYDGIARFPRLTDAAEEYSAEAQFEQPESPQKKRFGFLGRRGHARTLSASHQDVACMSLAKLLTESRVVDFVHMDIQGAEADIATSAINELNARARRLCVGTHGRQIEGQLFALFPQHDWRLEYEQPCKFVQRDGEMHLHQDGVQVWRNTRRI